MPVVFIMQCVLLPLVVFMSPECATSKPWCTVFEDKYVKKHLLLVAVDEAHCITDWSVTIFVYFITHKNIMYDSLFVGVACFVQHLRS